MVQRSRHRSSRCGNRVLLRLWCSSEVGKKGWFDAPVKSSPFSGTSLIHTDIDVICSGMFVGRNASITLFCVLVEGIVYEAFLTF